MESRCDRDAMLRSERPDGRENMREFRALRIDEVDGVEAGFADLTLDDLSEGDVVIKVSYSTINYKDALAATGAGRILRKFPLVGGIDLSGTVVSSKVSEFEEGDVVLVPARGGDR